MNQYTIKAEEYWELIYPEKVLPLSLSSDKFCCWCGNTLYHIWSDGVGECKEHFEKRADNVHT